MQRVKSYLTSRLQFVEFNGHPSSCQNILCGVPQGSILGPLFFLIYVNDLSKVSELVDLVPFANDTTYLFLIKTQIVF